MEYFAFRYDAWCGWLLGLFGAGRRFSRVIVTGEELEIRMGLGFHATIPTSSIAAARRWQGRVLGWGVHGWRGRWLVNGSSNGIVVLEINPPAKGRVLGVSVNLRELALSLEDPEGCCRALGIPLEDQATTA